MEERDSWTILNWICENFDFRFNFKTWYGYFIITTVWIQYHFYTNVNNTIFYHHNPIFKKTNFLVRKFKINYKFLTGHTIGNYYSITMEYRFTHASVLPAIWFVHIVWFGFLLTFGFLLFIFQWIMSSTTNQDPGSSYHFDFLLVITVSVLMLLQYSYSVISIQKNAILSAFV